MTTEQEIMEMDSDMLWKTLQIQMKNPDFEIDQEDLRNVKNGKKLKFPIYYLKKKTNGYR